VAVAEPGWVTAQAATPPMPAATTMTSTSQGSTLANTSPKL
jgi:hypothetical protein